MIDMAIAALLVNKETRQAASLPMDFGERLVGSYKSRSEIL